MGNMIKIIFELVKAMGKHASVSLDVTEDGKLKVCIIIDIDGE